MRLTVKLVYLVKRLKVPGDSKQFFDNLILTKRYIIRLK